VVTPRFRRLTADAVLRAYYSAGLGHPEKPGQQITFGSQMARDNLNAARRSSWICRTEIRSMRL